MAPCKQDNVGIFDTSTDTFSTVATNGDAYQVKSYKSKYRGAAAIGSLVYFGPYDQGNVGLFDTKTASFSTIPLKGTIKKKVYGNRQKYSGVVDIGDGRLIFSGAVQFNVGDFDTKIRELNYLLSTSPSRLSCACL